MIVNLSTFKEVLSELKTQKILCIDTETDGLKPYSGHRLCGIGISLFNGKSFYLNRKYDWKLKQDGGVYILVPTRK